MRRQPLLNHFPTPSFPPSTERSDIWPTVSGESGGSARPLNYMTPATTPPLGFPPPFESYVPGSSRAMWRKGQLTTRDQFFRADRIVFAWIYRNRFKTLTPSPTAAWHHPRASPSAVWDIAVSAYSVENPQHQSSVSAPFSAFDSIDPSRDALEMDEGLSQPHTWSYRTGEDDEGVHPFVGGETLSTAAHHASALTLSASLGGEAKDGISASVEPSMTLSVRYRTSLLA
ncbi:hypothetical protein BJV77DRAFT_966474 [Russula vinacea]|nr:hypothetical protein BJV77DRAFT_966474 [Russula vinacea]